MQRQATTSEFRSACSRFPTGVVIATRRLRDQRPWGITISSFTSVSLDPPLVLICIRDRSTFLESFEPGDSFAINVVSDELRDLIDVFASGGPDRFSSVPHTYDDCGAPILGGASAVFHCRVESLAPAGDHHVVVGVVTATRVTENRPVVYYGKRCSVATA